MPSRPDKEPSGEVSEVSNLEDDDAPVSPGDATAGYPASESGHPEEGTTGPNAPPRNNPPEPGNRSSR
jgi:hypothetical protein